MTFTFYAGVHLACVTYAGPQGKPTVAFGIGLRAPASVACVSLPCVSAAAAFMLALPAAQQPTSATAKKVHPLKTLTVGLASF